MAGKIILCPAACAIAEADPRGELQMHFECPIYD
jgi:hypothetical protein